MSAVRKIGTPDAAGNLTIQVSDELWQRLVEAVNDVALPVLVGTTAVANAWKVICKTQ